MKFKQIPISIVNESLHLTNEICHGWCHLNFFFGMEHSTQMYRTNLHCTVSTQYSFGCWRESIECMQNEISKTYSPYESLITSDHCIDHAIPWIVVQNKKCESVSCEWVVCLWQANFLHSIAAATMLCYALHSLAYLMLVESFKAKASTLIFTSNSNCERILEFIQKVLFKNSNLYFVTFLNNSSIAPVAFGCVRAI